MCVCVSVSVVCADFFNERLCCLKQIVVLLKHLF